MKMISKELKKFKDGEDGSMSIELLLVTPIIVWALLSTYVYFDVYRVEANVNRASLVIAEMFSREEAPITEAYLDGALQVLRTLTFEDVDPFLRVSVFRYQSSDTTHREVWSRTRVSAGVVSGLDDELDDAGLAAIKSRIPKMNTIDHAILVETRVKYTAPFSIGLGPFTGTDLDDVNFATFTVIRPRQSKLCFDETPADDDTGILCGPS
jgi:hypothetical protein